MTLRCLCLSDVHLDVSAARRLGGTALTGNIDVVLSAGDLGLDGTNEPAVYEALGKAGVPVLSVPGNHDGDEAYDAIVAALGWTDLHGRVVERDGFWFAGYGLRVWSNALSDRRRGRWTRSSPSSSRGSTGYLGIASCS
jgi:Icc-related predicted phosphoesterase